MEFNPDNKIVKLCMQGMEMEENGKQEEAVKYFLRAWDETTEDLGKFLSAYYMARTQNNATDKLKWLETSLQFALKLNDDAVREAIPYLYSNIARCYEMLGDHDRAKKNDELGEMANTTPSDKGPFYHGTKANLQLGNFLKAGGNSNYKSDLVMNHIYFTALVNGAGLAAALAKGDGSERVYIVEPIGDFESDPNVTNKKFPGNPTRSYRSQEPLKVVGEITEWVRMPPEELKKWKQKLADSKGEIIN